MRGFVNGLAVILTLFYPLAVYFGLSYLEPWQIALALAFLLAIRLLAGKTGTAGKGYRWLIIVLILYCGLSIFHNDQISLRLYPILVNLGLLTIFAASLYYPPPIIERLARLNIPDLPEKGIVYTRKVTQIWCLFFIFNGLAAFYTALWCSMKSWSLYNGLIAYVLIGLLMAGEYLVRVKTQDYAR